MTYKRPQLLKRAVRSVLRQSYPHFRVCVFDNASDDETAEVVAALARQDSRVEYVCHPKNIGAIGNFNAAMRSIQTPCFSLLSDDDLLLPNFYETTYAGLKQHHDAAFSVGTCLFLSDEAGSTRPGPRMPREGLYTPPEGLLEWKFFTHPLITGCLYRQEIVERYGVLQDLLTADLDLELRITAQAPYVVSFTPCAIVTSHSGNSTRLAAPEVWWKSLQTILCSLEAIPSITPETYAAVKAQLFADFAANTQKLAALSLLRGDRAYAEAARLILRTHYHADARAARLGHLIRWQSTLKPVQVGAKAAMYGRKKALHWKNRHLDRQYRAYVQELSQ